MCLGFWTFEDVIFWETLIFRMRKYFKHIFKKKKKSILIWISTWIYISTKTAFFPDCVFAKYITVLVG